MPHIVTRLTLHQRERHTVAIQPNVRCDYAGRMTNAVKSGSHARTRYGGRAIMLRRRNHHGLTWAHRLMWLCGLCASPALHAAPVHGKPTDHERPASYTLVINLTPAVCAANPSLQKLRQCQEGFSLTVSSLRPELSGGRQNENCSQESAELPPLQERIVERVMPDEQLRDSDWQRTGSCTGMSARTYFRTIANYAGRLRVPPEFNADREMVVRNQELLSKLMDLNPGLPMQGLQLRCGQTPKFELPVLMQVRVCYSPQGQYVNCPSTVQSNCPARFVVHGAP
jgi:ribonuclease T2